MRRLYKRLFCLCCSAVLAIILLPLPTAAGSQVLSCTEIPLYSGSDYLGCGLLLDGVTYVPLLTFAQRMLGQSCATEWDQESRAVRISADGFELSLCLGQRYMTVNGRCLYLEEGAYNINGTILVPIRELAKVFSLGVEWIDADWSVLLDDSRQALFAPGEEFYNADDLYWLSRVIFSEAGTQPMAGMIGVGNVVLNRLHDEYGRFGSSVAEVVFQPGQFDVVNNGTIYNLPSEDALVAAKLCLEGYNTVGDSKWFLNPSIGISTWMWTHKTLHCSIADHEFYS